MLSVMIRNTLIDWRVMRPVALRVPRRPPPPEPDDPGALSRVAVESARARGFAAAGVLAASRPLTWARFRDWLGAGHHGEMAYLERDAAARMRFDSILPFTKSVVAAARAVPGTGRGNVAAYARGEDYHRVVRRHLKALVEDLRPWAPAGSHFRVCVDTAPLLEREVALRAGLGFIGKNGMLIVPGVGSHVVLGEILTDVTMAPSAAPFANGADRCGSCTACLEACPTDALVAPRILDSRRCLSYLTIEKRGPLAPAEEAALSGRLFGCDDCQDVCPFNSALDPAGPARGPAASLDPEEILALDDAGFRRRFFHSAIWRATRSGLARNARAAVRG
jgi:epoxyqueuosine reductase